VGAVEQNLDLSFGCWRQARFCDIGDDLVAISTPSR
jgi:hypothetical protein